ncbi:MAG: histidine phosphotransferase family protein [Pseudomonadota bacterium]|jgi:histidine phosphotransferase ChpT|nr:histidine phosphotransferase family protein [Pseudomonadota bacterium]
MIEPSRLAAFIASRICHDLISPVASVNSALELLDEPGDAEMKAQAEQLLQNGAESAGARIQLLRYAFGSAGLSNTAADRHEVRQIVEGFMKSHKPSVEWDIDTAHFSCGHARVLMNLVIMATAAIPRGGVVVLKVQNDSEGLSAIAQAKGPKARLSEFVETALAGDTPEEGWSARTIQPLFAKMVADDLGGTITAAAEEECVTFTASGLRAEG